MSSPLGFDTDRYLARQVQAIESVLKRGHGKLYIEFGGKLIQDRHCARVLPGYREDTKLEILKRLCRHGEPVFVVSSRDILRQRVRGDFGTTYDQETIRSLDELRKRGLHVRHVVLSLLPHGDKIPVALQKFERQLKRKGIHTHRFFAVKNYPATPCSLEDFSADSFIETRKPIVAIISPGGGSGKFGVCLSQLYHEMQHGAHPRYFKFEIFPVHDLPVDHPLNLAYMAASADFYDVVMKDRRHGTASSYNRDLENYELLRTLANRFPVQGAYLKKISSATNMGVNKLSYGIIDDELVQKEAAAEIARRLVRYKFEVRQGKEDPKVLERTRTILGML